MTPKTLNKAVLTKGVLVFFITYGVFFAKYPGYILSPNSQEFLSNGDPMVTLFDMLYHVKYDSSVVFSGMNYPKGELIFMTDANGAFATTMRWINHHFFKIENHVPGIFLSIVFLLFGVCGFLLYRILQYFGIQDPVSIPLSVFITYLSPQILRTIIHYSLSFPFIIPYGMWWSITKYKNPKIRWHDFLFIFILTFFFLNNAYVGFITASFVSITGIFLYGMGYLGGESKSKKSGFIIFLIPVLVTMGVYLFLHFLDPYDDRLKLQWGFFYNHTRWDSFVAPKYSLAAQWLRANPSPKNWAIEWSTYLGIIPIIMISSWIIYRVLGLWSKKIKPLFVSKKIFWAFLASSVCLLIYAMNTTLLDIQPVIEPYMGKLTMFRASGRFSWPFYFTTALWSALIIQGWYTKIKDHKRWMAYIFLLSVTALYGYDAYYFVSQRFKGKDDPGYFSRQVLTPYREDFSKMNIDKQHYQAIYTIPVLTGWNEKIFLPVDNRTERGALTTSVITGIPMINGRLSRNSTKMTLLATQMSSHPWIKKEVIATLPDDKPILLVQGKGSDKKLSIGEKTLKKYSDLIYESKYFDLRSLPLDRIEKMPEYQEAFDIANRPDSTFSGPLIRRSFDREKNNNALFGQGCHRTSPGEELLIDTLLNFAQDKQLIFSEWSEVTTAKYGMPIFIIKVIDEKKHIKKKEVHSRTYKDIYKNWIRGEGNIHIPKGKTQLKISVRTNQPSNIDEIQIVPKGDTTLIHYGGYDLLYNYPIIKHNQNELKQ